MLSNLKNKIFKVFKGVALFNFQIIPRPIFDIFGNK